MPSISNSPHAAGVKTASMLTGTTPAKSSWYQVFAATPFDAVGLLVMLGMEGVSAQKAYFCDIAIGAGGSEVIIIADYYLVTGQQMQGSALESYFPVTIPKGSRLSARVAANASSLGMKISLGVVAPDRDDFLRPGPVATYGAVPSTSRGQPLTCGAATDGAWDEFAAATAHDHRWLIMCFGRTPLLTTNVLASVALDVGIGAGGSEQVLIKDQMIITDAQTDMPYPRTIGPIPALIPRGSRLCLRGYSSTTAPSIDYVVYGVG